MDTDWTFYTNNPDYLDALPTKNIELIPDAQYSLMEAIGIAPDGSVWVNNRLYGGVSCFDGKQWKTYHSEPGLPLEWVFDFDFSADGSAWFAGPKDVILQFQEQTWRTISFSETGYPGYVHHMKIAPDGTMWLSAGDNGLLIMKEDAWGKISLDAALIATEDDNSVNAIAAAPDGTMWFGTDAGIARLQKGKLSFFIIPNGRVNSLLLYSTGELWFGVIDSYIGPPAGREEFYYLARFNEAEEGYMDRKELTGTIVWSINEAPDGTLWFATNKGLYRYDGVAWNNWNENSGLLDESITDVAVDPDGSVWMTSGEFVSHFQYSGE
jgi:ligand-binding sensor domain-containing protein